MGGDLIAGQLAIGIFHQILEQRVFTLCERDIASAPADLAGDRVEHEIRHANLGVISPQGRSAQQRVHAGKQLVRIEGFRQVIVGAGIEAGDFIGDGVARREHQHRRAKSSAAQLGGDLESGATRKPNVEDDKRGGGVERLDQPRFAIVGATDVVTVLGKRLRDHREHVAIVLDDEDRRSGAGRWHRANLCVRYLTASTRGRGTCIEAVKIEDSAPLEAVSSQRFVYGVWSNHNIGPAVRSGARAGAVAAAAVTGALLGFGVRAGIASRPFNAAAALLMGNRARGVWGFVTSVSLVGELVVIAVCVAGGALCGVLLQFVPDDRRVRYPRVFAFSLSLTVAVALFLCLVAWAPEFVGAAPDGALSITQGAVLSLVVSAAYASGMGLAR